ncbi:MAG: hypothetical protein M4579_006388 [Chaenotheca gracillima]|nr:MAG: hypothetical protein M4579_006388 [Chaenotheca gracillima]
MGSSTGGRGKKKKKQGAHVRRGSVHHHERPKLKDNPAPPQVGGGTTTGLPTNVERLRSARTDFLNRLSDEAEEPEDPTMAHTTTTTRSVVETRSRPKRSETQREHRHHHRRDGSRRRSRSRERRSRRGTESTQRPLADHREWVTAAGIDGSGRLRHTESDVGVRRAHSTRVPPRAAEPRVESGLGRRRSVAAPTSVQAAPKTSGSSTVRSRATSDSRRPPLSR